MTANAKVAMFLGSIAASSDTVEYEGRQMNQCWVKYYSIKKSKISISKYLENVTVTDRNNHPNKVRQILQEKNA